MTKQVDDDFVIHERWDAKAANDGNWMEVIDKSGNDWGSFKLSLFDANVPRIRHAIERSERKAKAAARAKGVSSKDQAANIATAIDLMLDTFLLDWKLTGKSGKPIPFTRENVHRYIGRSAIDPTSSETVYPVAFVADVLFEWARDPLNFQPEDQEELPEGN